MSPSKKPPNIMAFTQEPYEDGAIWENSKPSEQKAIIEGSSLEMKKKDVKKSSMEESLQKNKKGTFKTKLNLSKKSTQIIPLSPTSVRDLISNGQDFAPFWTNYSNTVSKKLWCPLLTDSVDSVLNCSKQSFPDSMPNSQLLLPQKTNHRNKSSQKICYQSLQFSPPDTTVHGGTNIQRTRKLRIYPTAKQKIFFHKCFGSTRYIFNKLVEYTEKSVQSKRIELDKCKNNGCVKADKNGSQCGKEIHHTANYFCKKHSKSRIDYGYKLNLIYLRQKIFVKDAQLSDKEKWLKDIPYDTRQLVIKDFIAAKKSISTNVTQGNIKHGKIGFKSRKQPTQFFHIDKRAITHDLTLFKKRKVGTLRMRKKQRRWMRKNVKSIDHNCKIIRYQDGSYYLLLSIDKQPQKIKAQCGVASLDPGVRTFQTMYSPDGVSGKFGHRIVKKQLSVLGAKIDHLNRVKETKNGRTKKNINQRQTLLRTKIKNIVDNLHWQTASFLVKNFETIIIPKFESKKMSKRAERKINKLTVRGLLTLSHYKFRMKLMDKAKEYKRNVLVCTEEYTSKTCGICGKINEKLGSKKIFNCKDCKSSIDRDYNGARNILIRACTKIHK